MNSTLIILYIYVSTIDIWAYSTTIRIPQYSGGASVIEIIVIIKFKVHFRCKGELGFFVDAETARA